MACKVGSSMAWPQPGQKRSWLGYSDFIPGTRVLGDPVGSWCHQLPTTGNQGKGSEVVFFSSLLITFLFHFGPFRLYNEVRDSWDVWRGNSHRGPCPAAPSLPLLSPGRIASEKSPGSGGIRRNIIITYLFLDAHSIFLSAKLPLLGRGYLLVGQITRSTKPH